MNPYPNISGDGRLHSTRPGWRTNRNQKILTTAHAFITKTCLDAGKILHEDAIFELYMATKLENVLFPNLFSLLYHKMIPNLIKAVNAAKEKNHGNKPPQDMAGPGSQAQTPGS